MAATVSTQRKWKNSDVKMSVWDVVIQQTRMAQQKNADPFIWAVQINSTLKSAEVYLPSLELAHVLVSYICWDNHVPITWKFLEEALAMDLAPPFLVLALLSSSVIQNRHIHPTAYRLYMELLRRYAFSLVSLVRSQNYHRIMKSVDEVLQLSQLYGLELREPGLILVEFLFLTVSQLLEASLYDEGLLEHTSKQKSTWLKPQNMDIGGHDCFSGKKINHNDGLQKANNAVAVEIVTEFFRNKITSKIIYLACENMPFFGDAFLHQLQQLVANSTILKTMKYLIPETLLSPTLNICTVLSPGGKRRFSKQEFHAFITPGSQKSCSSQARGSSWSALWLPIDLFLIECLDRLQAAATCPAQILSGLTKTLQVINGMTWHDTFLGLWIAALRLVHWVSNGDGVHMLLHGPCLTILLGITALAVANIIEEEEGQLIEKAELSSTKLRKENDAQGKCRMGLITCLQLLGDYKDLLVVPQFVSLEANQAASKAVMFISGFAADNGNFESTKMDDLSTSCCVAGNLRHLIVEACIARKLLDTSAYFWPGYVNAQINQVPPTIPSQMSGWSLLMQGSPLTPPLVDALVATPASSLAEIEKIYEIAIGGSDEDKISAAAILCGASLHRGWSIQEHVLLMITSLLSPPIPPNYGVDSQLIILAPFLNTLLVGLSFTGAIQILSLHGLVYLFAGALMPICEVFGSCAPSALITLGSGENLSCQEVFSNAFMLLLKLWRFDRLPPPYVMGNTRPLGPELTPQYLLSVRNSKILSYGKTPRDRKEGSRASKLLTFPKEPITLESLPKFRRWYEQLKQCIAAPTTLESGNPVHEIVDSLLTMMFIKTNNGQHFTPLTTRTNNVSAVDDALLKLKLPSWDILEAIPYVLDAAFTACTYGRVSPRDLTTGFKDLADFVPSSLATIVSYLAAEVTRGIWKPATMDGTDWPSPVVNLSFTRQEVKRLLAATGVDVPSFGLAAADDSPVRLPLPLAALLSFTITYKLDKTSQSRLTVINPALKSLGYSCPWPSMPTIMLLWAQKMGSWNNLSTCCTSSTVFHRNRDAVSQLLRSCFQATLGVSSEICGNGGVGALLGSGRIHPVAPGILFLRVHHCIQDVVFMAQDILSLLILWVRDIITGGLPREQVEKLRMAKYGIKNGQGSLASSMLRLNIAALLGASLLWISGGSSLVQTLIQETLPSWFLSVQELELGVGESRDLFAMLRGQSLAYFAILCGAFAWGIDNELPSSKIRPKILTCHLEFLANCLSGRISLGCDHITLHSYVTCFVTLLVSRTPLWVKDIDAGPLKRLGGGLKQLNEQDLAVELLGLGGISTIGAAVEIIVESGY